MFKKKYHPGSDEYEKKTLNMIFDNMLFLNLNVDSENLMIFYRITRFLDIPYIQYRLPQQPIQPRISRKVILRL